MSFDLDQSLKRWARQEVTMDVISLGVSVALILGFLAAIVWRVHQ